MTRMYSIMYWRSVAFKLKIENYKINFFHLFRKKLCFFCQRRRRFTIWKIKFSKWNWTMWVSRWPIHWLKMLRNLTLNRAGPNPTNSVRGRSNLTNKPKLEDFHRTMDLLGLFYMKINFEHLLFSSQCQKISFWITSVRPKIYLITIFNFYRVTVRGRGGVWSDNFWKLNFQTPKSCPKSAFTE